MSDSTEASNLDPRKGGGFSVGHVATAATPTVSDSTEAATVDTFEDLLRWKREATEVIEAWELVWIALGQPGRLGESKATAALRVVLNDTEADQ